MLSATVSRHFFVIVTSTFTGNCFGQFSKPQSLANELGKRKRENVAKSEKYAKTQKRQKVNELRRTHAFIPMKMFPIRICFAQLHKIRLMAKKIVNCEKNTFLHQTVIFQWG